MCGQAALTWPGEIQTRLALTLPAACPQFQSRSTTKEYLASTVFGKRKGKRYTKVRLSVYATIFVCAAGRVPTDRNHSTMAMIT
jgi:hypothetical protein